MQTESIPLRPPRVSLLTTLGGPPWLIDDPADFGYGVQFESQPCGASAEAWPLCPTDPDSIDPKKLGEASATITVNPFAVVAPERCSTWTWGERPFEERAKTLLAAVESKIIAAELWTANAQVTNPSLDSATNPTLTDLGTQSDIVTALSMLEAHLSTCGTGAQGMIHMTRRMAVLLAGRGAVRREGNTIYTVNDTVVVTDAGYPGTAIAGADPGANLQAMIATGPVRVRRGPVQTFPTTFEEALDHRHNRIEYRAERIATAEFDACCHALIRASTIGVT